MSKPSKWPLSDQAVRYITPGFMLEYFASNRLTRACYPTALGFYPKAIDHDMVREVHDDNLFFYCVDGSGELTTDTFNGSVKAGDLVVLPAHTAHRYKASKSKPWTIYWIHFDGLEADALIKSLQYQANQPITHLGPQALLISDFTRLLALRKSGYQYSVFIYAASLVRQILCHLAVEITNSTAISRHNFNLDEIQRLMVEHIEGQLDLDTLANSAQLSRYHFSCKYKQLTGYPPIRHYIHMKMEHACDLLDNTGESIVYISRRLGYDDPLYFSRQFRKVMGISPSAYRVEQGLQIG